MLLGALSAGTLLLAGGALVSAAPAQAATAQNLVKDPSLRYGAAAWRVTSGTRVWVTSYGHAGHRAIGIRNLSGSPRTITLNDRTNTVARTTAGKTYTASAWVRIAQNRVSGAVRQGEWRGSSAHGTPAVTSAWLIDHGWHLLRSTYRAVASSDTIDLNILAWKLPPRSTFYISQISLVASGGATPTSNRALVFDDEFNGTSVDRSKWNVRNNSWASNEKSMMTSRSRNVSVSNGVLTLRAQRERYTAYGTTKDYTSGYVDTIGLASRRYGRWVMRAKLPSAKGMWPAFWLRSDHSGGEIDILEAIGGLPQMTVQTVFPNTNDGRVKKSHMYNEPAGNGISNWHVYGFTWTPTSMTWDIDGVKVFTVTSTDASWVSTGFKDTMNIRLNLQVGGSMPNYFNQPVDGSTRFPADFQVDYVRVYDR